MRKYILTIICLLAMSASGCGNGDKKTGVAIALADTTAGLIAWSEAVQVLIDLEEITADKAKGQFQVNDKIRTGVKQIREKLELGFASKEILDIASELIEEAVKAQDNGLIGIKSDSGKTRYREVMAFSQLSLRTAQNILKEIKLPPVPDPVTVADNLQPPPGVRAASRAGASGIEKWTRFLAIGQDFAFAVIRHNRLDQIGAFTAEKELNTKLEGLNKDRISVL